VSDTTKRRFHLSRDLGRIAILFLVIAGLTCVGIYQVWSQHRVIVMAYAIDQERFEHTRLLERSKRLELTLSKYKDPSTVRALARDSLGMHPPTARDEFHLPEAAVEPTRSFQWTDPLREVNQALGGLARTAKGAP
jgi:cell division protein FtsL